MFFSTLRRRLIAVCVTTVVFAMLSVIAVNFLTTKSRMLDNLDAQIRQLAESHSATIAEWISSKKSVVSSVKQAAGLAELT